MLREDTSFKRQHLDDTAPTPLHNSQLPNMQLPISTPAYRGTGANSIRPAPFASAPNSYFSASTSGRKCCPPLTQTEIGLLNKHKGCRKCRKFYVSHRGQNCSYDFPDGATYVPLTEEVAYEAMRKTAVASTYAPSAPSHDTLSAIQGTSHHHLSIAQPSQPSSSLSNAYSSYFAPPAISYSTPAPSVNVEHSAQIEEVSNANPDAYPSHSAPTVGTVLPSSSYQPFVLSDDSDNSGSHDDVSPISVPHLIWKGQYGIVMISRCLTTVF